ncbi:MAG: hypothetical protein ABEJ75_03295 [Candidatus Nanohaloarchaea archaeon]
MKLSVLNQAEAEDYAAETLGGDTENYGFRAIVSAEAEDPETTYEAVNRSTFLKIDGMGEIARDFGEDTYPLDVTKTDYAQELEELVDAQEILDDSGLDYNTRINAEKEGDSPAEAIYSLESSEISPLLVGQDSRFNAVILYSGGFQPRVQPTSATSPEEAMDHQEFLEDILHDLQ